MIEVTAEVVRDLLDYNPETGEFIWKTRNRKYFECDRYWKKFNTQFAGKSAGYSRPDGYRCIRIFHKEYLTHRLTWLHYYGEWPNEIDHINRVRDDNRIENLRNVTSLQNKANRSKGLETASQYKGVAWDKRPDKWKSQIQINGKNRHLGYFITEEDAARAYDRAALEHFGIYANLNFPIEDYDLAA